MKLKWSPTINHVHDQPNLCWINLAKSHMNLYLIPWIPFKGFQSSLLQHWLQNIYGSNLPNSLYTILHIRDPTVDTYSIVYYRWPKSVEIVSLGHISASYINIVLAIVTNILVENYAAKFWCEAPDQLNPIFLCFFNRSSKNFEALKITFSVWYILITNTRLLSSLFNNTLYRVCRHSIEPESNKFLN